MLTRDFYVKEKKEKRANFFKSEIQQTNFLKYFGFRLDNKLIWEIHTREKMN